MSAHDPLTRFAGERWQQVDQYLPGAQLLLYVAPQILFLKVGEYERSLGRTSNATLTGGGIGVGAGMIFAMSDRFALRIRGEVSPFWITEADTDRRSTAIQVTGDFGIEFRGRHVGFGPFAGLGYRSWNAETVRLTLAGEPMEFSTDAARGGLAMLGLNLVWRAGKFEFGARGSLQAAFTGGDDGATTHVMFGGQVGYAVY